MATLIKSEGWTAGGTISKHRALEYDATGGFPEVQHGSADTDIPVAVSLNDATETNPTALQTAPWEGVIAATASGAITNGDKVCIDSSGKVKTAASGDYVCGQALIAASNDLDIIKIFATQEGLLA